MKRKSSPPLAADDRRRRKKRGAAGRDTAVARSLLELRLLLLAGKPAPPHLLVTEVFYTPLSHNHNHDPSSKFPACAFNRRGAIVSVPLDGAAGAAAPPPSAVIRRRGPLADLYRRCMTFVGATPHGCLAFAGSRSIFVVNPVTEALQGFETFGHCEKAIVATGGGHGCNLFVSLGALLSPPTLWRLDDDGEGWSQFPVAATAEQTGNVMSAVNCNGGFYLLHEDGLVSMVDASAGEKPAPLRMEKLSVASLADHLSPPCNKDTLAGEGHLVESDGEVLFVRKLLTARDAAAPFCDHAEFVGVAGFEVYRLDVAGRRWARVEALPGDTAVFVSPESAFAVRASETAAAGCMGGCAYFVGEKRCCFACCKYGGSTWGVYSMEERKVLFEHDVANRGGRSEALWFLPNAM